MRPAILLLVALLPYCAPSARAQDAGLPDPFVRKSKATRPPAKRTPQKKSVSHRKPKPDVARDVRADLPELASGDQVVRVTDATKLVQVSLGLAAGGVTIVEFPGDDPVYAIHPGDDGLVTVDTTSKRSSDPIVLRPGARFAPPSAKGERWPSALVTVQMSSGLLVALTCYPVRELRMSSRRLVVAYDRTKVVADRRTAGLSSNLGQPQAQPTGAPVPNAGFSAPAPSDPVPFEQSATRRPSGTGASTTVALAQTRPRSTGPVDAARITHEEIERVMAKPKHELGKFSEAVHGLSVAATATRDVDARHRIVTVAIRNATRSDIRLVTGEPSILIETVDGENRPVQVVAVDRVRVESTSVERLVPAGGIVYVACLYRTPTLGARQRLRVSVSHIDAADEPAAAELVRP